MRNTKKKLRSSFPKDLQKNKPNKKAPLLLEAQELLRLWEAGDKEVRDIVGNYEPVGVSGF